MAVQFDGSYQRLHVDPEQVADFVTTAKNYKTDLQTQLQDTTTAVSAVLGACEGDFRNALEEVWRDNLLVSFNKMLTALDAVVDAIDVGKTTNTMVDSADAGAMRGEK